LTGRSPLMPAKFAVMWTVRQDAIHCVESLATSRRSGHPALNIRATTRYYGASTLAPCTSNELRALPERGIATYMSNVVTSDVWIRSSAFWRSNISLLHNPRLHDDHSEDNFLLKASTAGIAISYPCRENWSPGVVKLDTD